MPRRLPELKLFMQRVDAPSRWGLFGVGLWVLWRTRDAGWEEPWLPIVASYALITLLTTGLWLSALNAGGQQNTEAKRGRWIPWAIYVACLADALFVSALIWRDRGLGSPLYVLLGLLALKAVGLAQFLPGMVWTPFAFGPLYVVALRLASASFAFMTDGVFLSRYLLLWAWLVGLALLAWELERRTAQANALKTAMAQQQAALAQKTEVLQRTAADLGDRVLELRSLQEVSRALASTLRLDEILEVIVERLRGVTGSARCAAALIDAENAASSWSEGYLNGILSEDAPTTAANQRPVTQEGTTEPSRAFRLPLAAEPATIDALRNDRMVRVANGHSPLPQLLGRRAYLIAPLAAHGRQIGALYVTDEDGADGESAPAARPADRDKIEQFLNSFSYFAATAIENARLYQDASEKRRELEAVLAGIGDGVVVVDPNLHLILMNPVARDILGSAGGLQPPGTEPLAGTPLRSYLESKAPSGTALALAELLSEALRSQPMGGQEPSEQIRELVLPAPGSGEAVGDGAGHVYGALASPVLDADGEVTGVVAVLRDITAQKELERMKSNFLSAVSHELRTPLHSIKGFVEIILMGKTGPVTALQQDFLRTVKDQTTVLQRMIDDLLEFSRMEAGRVKLHVDEVSLRGLAQTVASKLTPLAAEAGLQLVVQMDEGLPEIGGDRVRLEQVVTNLAENAIKFTPAGGKVRISAAQLGDRVRLTVSDTGIGVPPEEQERIFDRFYQVDGSERRAYRGAGLGLSICKHIVERHGGRIWVESDGVPGRGSRFHVELPIEFQPREAPTIDFTTPTQ